jgi:AraC-like DNA-binding protein
VPKPPLDQFIERFWYSSEAPAHQKIRVAPTGTMELVFNLDDDDLGFYDVKQPEFCNGFSGAVFSGAHARPLFVETRKHVMGVHFKPGGAFPFLGAPASEFADAHVDVAEIWGGTMQESREQLCTAQDPTQRFRVLEEALVDRLKNSVIVHRAVRAAVEILKRNAGEARTRDLAAQLGLSQRHFIRTFSDQVGLTPKQFGRVQRFQRALEMARSPTSPDWADISASCGYFDQSHFIHDFRMLSGFTPTEFHRRSSEGILMNPPIVQ